MAASSFNSPGFSSLIGGNGAERGRRFSSREIRHSFTPPNSSILEHFSAKQCTRSSRGGRMGFVAPRAEKVESASVLLDEWRKREKGRVLRVGLICGGPSAERGISLNSARSVLDHIQAGTLRESTKGGHLSSSS
ncbi:hypothetical protein ACLOJK_023147 [Asimina triloba]